MTELGEPLDGGDEKPEVGNPLSVMPDPDEPGMGNGALPKGAIPEVAATGATVCVTVTKTGGEVSSHAKSDMPEPPIRAGPSCGVRLTLDELVAGAFVEGM